MPTLTDTESSLTFPILIGDIGGTNARFALLLDAFAEPKLFPIIPTTSYASIEEALQTSILDKTSVQPRSAIIAVAGPVKGDDIPLTNAGWVIKPKDMLTALSLEDVIIINDFEAQALAIASIGAEGREQIGPGSILEDASCAVLGPGTGLGVAGLVHAQRSSDPGSRRRRPCRCRAAHRARPSDLALPRTDRGPHFGRAAPLRPRHHEHLPCGLRIESLVSGAPRPGRRDDQCARRA